LLVARNPDEVDLCREEVVKDLARELGRIKLQDRGVLVQASTLGSLEALLEFLKDSKIPVSRMILLSNLRRKGRNDAPGIARKSRTAIYGLFVYVYTLASLSQFQLSTKDRFLSCKSFVSIILTLHYADCHPDFI
jgi:hypothetical protein